MKTTTGFTSLQTTALPLGPQGSRRQSSGLSSRAEGAESDPNSETPPPNPRSALPPREATEGAKSNPAPRRTSRAARHRGTAATPQARCLWTPPGPVLAPAPSYTISLCSMPSNLPPPRTDSGKRRAQSRGGSLTPRPSPIPPQPTAAPARSLKTTGERGLGGKLRGSAPSATWERGLDGSPEGPAPIRRRGRACAVPGPAPPPAGALGRGQVPGCGPGNGWGMPGERSRPGPGSAHLLAVGAQHPGPDTAGLATPTPVGRTQDTVALTHYYPTCSKLGTPVPFLSQPQLGF